MAPKKRTPAYNPFGKGENADDEPVVTRTIEETDAALYGKIDLSNAGQKPVKKIPLDQITPDPAQPRRTVPKSVIKEANSANIPVWQAWHRIAGRLIGKPIDLKTLLRGEGEGEDTDPLGIPLVIKFFELVGLASTIYREGLSNPISIFSVGPNRYQIESGEGRWLSHMMLRSVLEDEKWGKIDALVVTEFDVWRQASENGARRPLNAISIARQLALLVMDLYRGKDGISLLPYGEMVQNGDVDRKFYAQVANGVVYRIPKGQGERIIQATGLKSRSQMTHYRSLLDIPDDVWVKADEEDWAEGRIREHVKPPAPPQDMFTTVNISQQNSTPLLNQTVTHKVRYLGRTVGFIRMDEDGTARIQHYNPDGTPSYQQSVTPTELRDLPTPGQLTPQNPFSRETPATISTAIKVDARIIPRPEQDLFKQIFQHKSGKLYQITGTMPNNQVMAFMVDQDGNRKGRITEQLDRADLFAKPTAPEFNAEAAMANILGDEDEQSVEVGRAYTHDDPAYDDEINGGAWFVVDRLLSAGGMKPTRYEDLSVECHQVDAYGQRVNDVEFTFLATHLTLDPNHPYPGTAETAANDDTATTEQPLPTKLGDHLEEMLHALYLNLPFDKSTRYATTRNTLKEMGLIRTNGGAWDVEVTPDGAAYLKAHELDREVVIEAGKAYRMRDGRYPGEWYLVEVVHPNGAINGHIVDAQGNRTHSVGFTFSAINLKLDPHHPYPPESDVSLEESETPELPDWAIHGTAVKHIPSGAICDISGTTWSPEDGLWFARVDVRGGGSDEAPVRDFEPYTEEAAAPREPHPARHPSRMNGVIVQEQHLLGLMQEMARRLQMEQEEDALRNWQTTTAYTLKTRLHAGGREKVDGFIGTGYTAAMNVLNTMAQRMETIYAHLSQVADEEDAALRSR